MTLNTKMLLTFLLLVLGSKAIAQTAVAESLDSLQANPIKYMSPMQYAFMFHEETPWMVKGSLDLSSISSADFPRYNGMKIGFEKRIIGGLTADASIELSNLKVQQNVAASLRYYYNMKSRKEKENIPFNLSGNYFALGTNLGFSKKGEGYYSSILGKEMPLSEEKVLRSAYFIKWGMQRRYLKSGFVDLGLVASISRQNLRYGRNNLSEFNNFTIYSTTSLGIAFAKDKSNLDKGKLCSVIKCHDTEKSALKLNFSGLLFAQLSKYFADFGFSPEISFERKIGKSIFSINNTVRLSAGFGADVNNFNFGYGAEYTFETRMYYNLKNRIQKGKTGNGLSANYISVGVFNNYSNNNYYRNSDYFPDSEQYGFIQPQITLGSQRFVGDHFYYDIGFNYRPNNLRVFETDENDWRSNEAELFSKVGYRF